MIFVTGGTGTVGSRLMPLLLAKGEQVRLFSRDVDKARTQVGERAGIIQGDLRDPDAVRAALDGSDRIFLLTGSHAATSEPGDQLQLEENVIAAAKDASIRRVVKVSVVGADEQSPLQYARGHRKVEKELEASGLAYTLLRCTAFMQNFFETVADGSIYTSAQDGRVPLVDARDIAAVAAVALTEDGHEGRIYDVTGPEAITYDEAARTLSEATGERITHVRVPEEGVVAGMTNAGLPEWLARDLAAQYAMFAAGAGGEPSGDVAAVTGRSARSLRAFADEEFVAGAR